MKLRNAMMMLLPLGLAGCCGLAHGPEFCKRMHADMEAIEAASETGRPVSKPLQEQQQLAPQPKQPLPQPPAQPAPEKGDDWLRL